MKKEVEKAFGRRFQLTHPHRGAYSEVWYGFLHGRKDPDGPMGVDLLLGKTQVTTLGPEPESGEWRLVVRCPQTEGQF